jgi:hypothetical protein
MSLALLAMAVAGALLSAAPAGVSQPAEPLDEPETTRIYANFHREIILRLDPVRLRAGQPRYFYGHYGATTRWPMLQGVQIRCTSRRTGKTYSSVNTTMDHLGGSEVRVVAVRWLFRPPTTGRYACAMNGFATRVDYDGEYLTVVGGERTDLTMATRPSLGGREWRVTAGHNPSAYVDDPDTAEQEDRATVMRRVWRAGQRASSVRVLVGLEASRDYYGTEMFVGRSRVVARQLRRNGTACAPAAATSKVTTWDVHHIKVHLDLAAAVRTKPGCTRRFRIKTVLAYVPHPDPDVTRHGGFVEDGTYTNTIAINQR